MGAHWFPDMDPQGSASDHAGLLRRAPTDDLTAGSADGGPDGGLTQTPGHHPAGHAPSAKTSVAIPIVVLLVLVSFSALLLWWIFARLRRSRRLDVPAVQVSGDNVRVKPMFLDVELSDAKQWRTVRWSQLAPVAVGFLSDADRTRWDTTFACESALKTNTQPDLLPSPRSSTLRPPSPFGMFSRSPSPATTLVPDETCGLTITVFVAMPSPNRSKAGGELYLGVARSSL
ncbi:hypothetical protein GY45DRAFT_559880 [Cubamyces sp. BRFM 1775]|nr:hypothetical protein GY45DRAFT_559880 [Cubamyces sp. BRFM 1775]